MFVLYHKNVPEVEWLKIMKVVASKRILICFLIKAHSANGP